MHEIANSGEVGDTADAMVDAVLRASRVLVAVAARSIAEIDDSLTVAQFRTLVALSGRGALTVGALADELGVHQSTATRMCDRLVKAGLISRAPSPTSRREVVVKLEAPGRSVVRRVTDRRRRAIAKIVANVPTGQRSQVVAALTAFGDAAGELPDQDWAWGWDQS